MVRNLQTPFFLQSSYVTTIQENQVTGTSVLQVSARDDDTTVSSQFLKGNPSIKYPFIAKQKVFLNWIFIPLYYFQSPFNVVTMRAIGDDSGPTYFNFNANTGVITVRQDLRLDTATLYRVCHQYLDVQSTCLSTGHGWVLDPYLCAYYLILYFDNNLWNSCHIYLKNACLKVKWKESGNVFNWIIPLLSWELRPEMEAFQHWVQQYWQTSM